MDIFAYSDYRTLLKDLYTERKGKDPKFSYRFIAQRAGFKSAGFFYQIVQGKTNISMQSALGLAAVFKLKSAEVEYFENLVQFNQAKTQSDKQHFFRKIAAVKKGHSKTLDERHHEIFTHWYYFAVRELLAIQKFKGDYKKLAEALIPPITAAEAREAVKVLQHLGLVRITPAGEFERLDEIISTGDFWSSVAITKFQMDTTELALQSFERVPPELRNHSTLTLSISKGEYLQIKEELGKLRKRLLELAKGAIHPDRVYQINLNVFPITQIHED